MRVKRMILHGCNHGIAGDLLGGIDLRVIILLGGIPAEELVCGLPLRHGQLTVGLTIGDGDGIAIQHASVRLQGDGEFRRVDLRRIGLVYGD